MTESVSQRPYLRVVSSASETLDERHSPNLKSFVPRETKQPMLFSDASLHTLGFIKAAELEADRFVGLIKEAKPRVIFDLRPVPSFAHGTLQRRTVFSLFAQEDVTYFDVAGVLGVSTGRDALLNPALLINALQVNILRSTKGLSGPIFFFINDDLFLDDYFSSVARHLPHVDRRGWDIACWPNEVAAAKHDEPRNLVFISHANPQDNEIALWLSARLAASGYQVWSDVTRLLGGEVFWDTIEEAIRKRAAKVIALLSKRGHQKPGLLDEVNVAVATERSEGIDRFVIPVRVDDLPYTEIRANLARRNVIDGSVNLAGALSRILAILREDRVPTSQGFDSSRLARPQISPNVHAKDEWLVLHENKVEIKAWPKAVRKFRLAFGAPKDFSFPAQVVAGGIVTFEEWDLISQVLGSQIERAGEASFEHGPSSTGLDIVFSDRGEATRATASLLRQGWDKACEAAGLTQFILARNNSCWFLTNGVVNANRVRYLDAKGIERHKALVGKSPRRGVYWHFAIEARPNVADQSVRVIPHVIFSDDGKTPLLSDERQHALRRGFCRNWWNARWRDLLFAMLNYISSGAETINLPLSQRNAVTLSARLTSHSLPLNGETVSPNQLLTFDEPRVVVGFEQETDDPKEGLLLFGPVRFERNPKVLRAGVVGTREGIELFRTWSKQFNEFQADPSASRNTRPFPGFEAVFGARWLVDPVHSIALSRTDLINNMRLADRHQAIFKSSGMYIDAIIKAVRDDDVGVDIWYVVIPDEVYVYGRPGSRIPSAIAIATPGAMGKQVAKRFTSSSPSLFAEDNQEALIYDHHLDFHHQVKARLLGVQAVTQVLRESSIATIASNSSVDAREPSEFMLDEAHALDVDGQHEHQESALSGPDLIDPELSADEIIAESAAAFTGPRPDSDVTHSATVVLRRHMQDRASVAWNLSTATFFKAGGRPWRVASARQDVCYIGLIFKRDDQARSRHACCGAQMFLQDGDGLVFKGAMGPWYSPETKQFHLSRNEARRLISKVLETYSRDGNRPPPRELFIHGRTRFNHDEWTGFCDAVDGERTRLVGVRISRSSEYKLFSNGEMAVRRGTAIYLGPRLGLLWTTGFVERLGTYPGRETPNPLRVEITNDTGRPTDIKLVMKDILMLTKMNFNSCIYGDGIPVTMRFADAIGDVLMTAKDKEVPPLPFRYYI
jgi:hypothetical protein